MQRFMNLRWLPMLSLTTLALAGCNALSDPAASTTEGDSEVEAERSAAAADATHSTMLDEADVSDGEAVATDADEAPGDDEAADSDASLADSDASLTDSEASLADSDASLTDSDASLAGGDTTGDRAALARRNSAGNGAAARPAIDDERAVAEPALDPTLDLAADLADERAAEPADEADALASNGTTDSDDESWLDRQEAPAPDTDVATTTTADAPAVAALAKLPTPIHHVLIIVKENHTFDNYFTGFPDAATTTHAFKFNQKTGRRVRILRPIAPDRKSV